MPRTASAPPAVARPARVRVPGRASAAAPSGDLPPRHVAIIMDGNRRWARAHSVSEVEGHGAGVAAIRPVVRRAVERGVAVLSLYAFSRENWGRSDLEVQALMSLLGAAVRDETPELAAQGVKVLLLGRREELPPETRASIEEALDTTAGGQRMTLAVAFNYSGRSELVDAARRCLTDGLPPDAIDESAIAGRLYTAGLPDPDLLIRTGGDQRISNFLIWQAAYAELHFSDRLWPDFDPAAFDEALADYARRSRRFGR